MSRPKGVLKKLYKNFSSKKNMKTLVNSIVTYLQGLPSTAPLFDTLTKTEKEVLQSLNLESTLGFTPQPIIRKGLFGYAAKSQLRSDFSHPTAPDLLIEVKFVRCKEIGAASNTECDLKNGLAQVIEQATCAVKNQAILLVLDAGRARLRKLTTIEKSYIKMFKTNPFDVKLAVIRARIDHNTRAIHCDII